jgi:hypothetical protein
VEALFDQMNPEIRVFVDLDTSHLAAAPMAVAAATLAAAILVAAPMAVAAAILVAAPMVAVAAILVASTETLETTLEIAVHTHLDMTNPDTCYHYQHKLGNPPFASNNLPVYTCTSFLFYFFNFPLLLVYATIRRCS